MGSAMSLSCSKRKATSQDLDSSSQESCKRQKICSANDDEIPSLPVTAAVGFFTRFTRFICQQDKKDVISSSLSLPSPPNSLSQNCKHHVFPSFHGADVRTTILSHIMESFRRKGINTFIDNEIERSKSIGPELVEAIRGSKIAIVLLSKNYASSSWCLDELAEIMICKEVLDQKVLPIFYEVDPTDIKKQTGDFGKAFRKTCKGKKKEHIERWIKALEDVAQIAGEHSRNWRNEAAMIETISINVSKMLNNSTPSRDFDCLVGMRAHMEEMKQLLRLDLLDEVRMIGIWGPPGIGKTTIARFLYNQVSNRFQLGAIMVNIKECYLRPRLDEYGAQLQLQQQMLSQISNQKDIEISHLGAAQEWLKHMKVFLVLDDVNHVGQLDALAKETRWFGPGSRIIFTTENRRVLDARGINLIYKVNLPSCDEAFEIFCMHAFGQKHPDDGFYGLAKKVTYLAGELPLGLKVLGSALRGMSKQEWERTLPMLANRLDGEIESIIKFSFDALLDEDKYLFLYIACLFIDESRNKVEDILAKKLPYVRQGLDLLADRSLISIEDGLIEMHTLLQQFGRETSRKQFVHHGIAKLQLLVGERDICELLSDDSTDCRRFIGMNFDIPRNEEELEISEKSLERMSDLQFVRIHGQNVDHPDRLHSLLCHSQKIISLDWSFFQNICLPSAFNPDFLVKLEMQDSKLQKLWEGPKQLRNLKWMDLSYSKDLKELPDLSTATNLEELKLRYCSSLVELPSSIENAASLTDLDLSNCSKLVELPSLGNATKLERLDLYNCSSLVKLHPFIVTNLQKLDLRGCSSLVKLPSSIENATSLTDLDLNNCSNLVELPFIGNATKLKRLNLSNCSNLVKLHPFIVTNLQELDLTRCSSLVKLPSSIENATSLTDLDLNNCSNLVELPSLKNATKLQRLNLYNCSSLVKLHPFIVTNFQMLDLRGCSSLVELPSLGNATKLERLNLYNCSSLVKIHPFIGTNLQRLDLVGCSSLVKLPSLIGDFTSLRKIDLRDCSSLMELPVSIGTATNLQRLNLTGCSSLVELPSSIGNLQQLKDLTMCGCSKLEALPTNINLESLNELDLADCSQLKSFPEISTNIEYLNLKGTAIKEVPLSIMSWSRLIYFRMTYFESLKDFPHALDIIKELDLNKNIQEVAPWVKRISCLRRLILCDCNNLVSLPQFSDSLLYLDATNCKSLERLDCSFNNPWIDLNFINCLKLNQEARDLIMHPSTRGSAILPGSQVPAWFDYRATGGSSLTIKLNERHLSTSLEFKACIMLVMDEEETDKDWIDVAIEIKDKQNDLKVPSTDYHLINPILTDHIYTFRVQVDKEFKTSTELVFEFTTDSNKRKIGGCGLSQIVEVPSS